MYVGVHLTQTFDVQRRVRQYPFGVIDSVGFWRRGSLGLTLCARTDQGSEVIEVQFARCDIACEIGTLTAGIHGQSAMQIAVSDLAGKVGDAPVVGIALKIAGKP